MGMKVELKIAKGCWNSDGLKKGCHGGTKRARRANKRGARAKARRLLEE